MTHACCGWSDLRHANTCHHCAAVETPMSADTDLVGEPVCERCARTIYDTVSALAERGHADVYQDDARDIYLTTWKG